MPKLIGRIAFILLTTALPCLAAAQDLRAIAAKVGDDAISLAEVQLEMRKALEDRQLAADEQNVLQAQTLGLLVNRQLVIQYLEKTQLGATTDDLEQQLERIAFQLKRRELTLADQLEQLGLSEIEFRRSLAWEIGWPRYLQQKMTPENIKKYFEQHPRDFDGTRLHVAHVLIKVEKPDDPASVQAAVDRAGDLRDEILAKKITFTDAAKKHSQAPTAEAGGDIGLISRHEPMPPAFNEAAFELQVGETSEPVLTSFGVHLIHCLEVAPGKRLLSDDGVEPAVREDLIRYLFLWIAEKQRATAKIEFTGAVPYFDPASGKLVVK